jgi:hypothetical protein
MMLMRVFESKRRFQVWRWSVGHTGLLLRANPTEVQPTRVEVLFKPAYVVSIPSLLESLRIETVEEGPLFEVVRNFLGRTLNKWENLYSVASDEVEGWVVGGSVFGREDDRAHFDPSTFDGTTPPSDVRTLFDRIPVN